MPGSEPSLDRTSASASALVCSYVLRKPWPDGELAFAHQAGALAGHIGGAHIGKAARRLMRRGKSSTWRVPSTFIRRASSSEWSKRTVAAE